MKDVLMKVRKYSNFQIFPLNSFSAPANRQWPDRQIAPNCGIIRRFLKSNKALFSICISRRARFEGHRDNDQDVLSAEITYAKWSLRKRDSFNLAKKCPECNKLYRLHISNLTLSSILVVSGLAFLMKGLGKSRRGPHGERFQRMRISLRTTVGQVLSTTRVILGSHGHKGILRSIANYRPNFYWACYWASVAVWFSVGLRTYTYSGSNLCCEY